MAKAFKKSTVATSENLTKVTFLAPASIQRAFRIKAAELDTSMTQLHIKLMEGYVKGKIQINGV